MNLGQMLLVLLAVILFSAIVITMYNSMSIQIEMATNNIFYKQGVNIVTGKLHRYEAELLGGQLKIDQLFDLGTVAPNPDLTSLITTTSEPDTLNIGDAQYIVRFTTEWYADLYTPLTTPPPSNYVMQRFYVTIHYGDASPIHIGGSTEHFWKVQSSVIN